MQLEEAGIFILDKLKNELPEKLYYHNVQHTQDVLEWATALASHEKIRGHDLILLKTAALYHDSGFLETYAGHEAASCKMAESVLPVYGYSQEDIHEICRLIKATKLPQQPVNRLSMILCDADLYYLGTMGYRETAENLYQELYSLKLIQNRAEWKEKQIQFLQNHHYFTESAKELLTDQLQQTLILLQTVRN